MKHFLLSILLLLAASPGWAKPTMSGPSYLGSAQTVTWTFDATTEASPLFGAKGLCVATFIRAGSETVTLYQTTAGTATSGTSIATFAATTTSPTSLTIGQPNLYAVSDGATAGGSLTVHCSPLQVTGGGVSRDADGDGRYEVAYLWDADGDGSREVTCTAKDVPDLACKAAGEVIYRDWADDLNCAMHGCGYGQMELDGSIYHKSGVTHVNFPCWDAREPAGFNDPAATSESLRDQTSDTAWGHCPAGPNYATNGRRLATVATMGWKGEIIGAGSDPRNPDTTTGYKRDRGSYIADDRGPSWISGAQSGLNSWFGLPSFIRGINFGFQHSTNTGNNLPVQSGEWSVDGDSIGGGTVSGDQTLDAIDGDICVTESGSWPTGLEAGDIIEVRSTSQTTTFNSQTVVTAMRVRDTPAATDCNGAGTAAIPVGGRITSGTAAQYIIEPPITTQLTNGSTVVHARSDYLDNATTISGFTVMHQDSWNEPNGDCAGSGVWDTSGDGSQADFDCDTNPLFGLFGGGTGRIQDIVIRDWHNHSIDGDSNVGSPMISRVRWFYGNGGTIFDPGSNWRADDLEIRDSQFGSDVIAMFGPGVHISNLRIHNSSFLQISTLSAGNTGLTIFNVFEKIRVFNSSFGRLFNFACGSRQNTFRDIEVSGHSAYGVSQTNGSIARFNCASTTNPIEMNTFDKIVYNGKGLVDGNNATSNTGALFIFDFDDTNTSSGANASAIARNSFNNVSWLSTDATASSKICLFGVQDDEATGTRNDGTPDYSQEDVFALNTFFGNSIRSTGGATDFVYCNCGLWDDVDNATANECDKAIKGTGGAGANPRGCMNFDAGAAPANETCS